MKRSTWPLEAGVGSESPGDSYDHQGLQRAHLFRTAELCSTNSASIHPFLVLQKTVQSTGCTNVHEVNLGEVKHLGHALSGTLASGLSGCWVFVA